MKKSLKVAMWDVMYYLAVKLEGSGAYYLLPQEEFEARLYRMAQRCERLGRINELQRIKDSTLDAESDVWSKTDDGQVVSLTERLATLDADWWQRPTKPTQILAHSGASSDDYQ